MRRRIKEQKNIMSPDLYNFMAFMGGLKDKTVPEISRACAAKIRSMELSGRPDRELTEHLKSMILLIRHLLKPPVAKDEKVRQFLIEFFTRVQEHDRRAKQVIQVLQKMAPPA